MIFLRLIALLTSKRIAKSLKTYYTYYVKYEIELDGCFTVDINYWKNKVELFYEDMKLNECEGKKNTFLLGNEECRIGGTLFSGIYLFRGERSALIYKLFWYDYIACILPFIAGLIGSLLGALLGAISFFLCYKLMPYVKNYFLRLLICLGVAGVVLLVVLILASLFPALFFAKS